MKYLKSFIGFIITFFSLFIVFKRINFSEIFQIMSSTNIKYILLSAFLIIISILLKSLRWQLILRFFTTFNLKDVFISLSIGNMFNMLLPFRSGDLIRVITLSKKKNILKTSILGTVVYEHALDLFALALIFCIAISTYNFPISRWIKFPVFSLSFGCGLFFIFIFLFKEKIKKMKKWVNEPENNSSKIYFKLFKYFINYILSNLSLFYSWQDFLKIFGYTIFIWFVNGCWLYFLFLSFDPSGHYHFGIGETSVLLLSTSLAVMIPSAPSYAGTLHLATLIVLKPTEMPQELIVSYAILIHAVGAFIGIMVGFVSWMKAINLKGKGIFKTSIMQFQRRKEAA